MAHASNQGGVGVGVGTPPLKGILKKSSSPAAPESVSTFAASRRTMTSDLRALMARMAQGAEFGRGSTAHSGRAAAHSVSATANTVGRKKSLVAQRSSTGSKCKSCRKPVQEFESVVLKNCQRHEVCAGCVFVAIKNSLRFNVIPVCPVKSCHAVLAADEIEAYRRKARVNSSRVEEEGEGEEEGEEEEDADTDSEEDSDDDDDDSDDNDDDDTTDDDSEDDSEDGSGDENEEDDEDEGGHNDDDDDDFVSNDGPVGDAVRESGKTPMSSTHDDSEEIFEEGARAPVVKARCDNCNRLVTGLDCLNVRKCRKKHMVCFDCVRATMNVSRTLVRCPAYRECKSMMSRDEVMQVKYDTTNDAYDVYDDPDHDNHDHGTKNAANHRKGTKSKTKQRPAFIYPDGLPHGDLWPVLTETQCSKCGRKVGPLNGIVLKQCNTHSVCVSCVQKSLASRTSAIKCPMFPSCKALMLEDEVEAFVDRFGSSPTKRTSSA